MQDLAARLAANTMSDEALHARVARAQLYRIDMTPTPRWREIVAEPLGRVVYDHFRYFWKLEQAGRLFGSGPIDFRPDQPVEAMAIIAAASHAEAEQIAAAEPFQRAGVRSNLVRAHTINEGIACYVARALVDRTLLMDAPFDPDVSGIDLSIESLTTRHAPVVLYRIQMEPTDKQWTEAEAAQVSHDHFVWLRENEMAANLFTCGPTERLDGKDGGGSGMGIVAAATRAQAEHIAALEPNNVRGYRVLTVSTWTIKEGVAATLAQSLAALSAIEPAAASV